MAPGETNLLDLRMVYDVDANTVSYLYKNPSATLWTDLHTLTPTAGNISAINNVGMSTNVASGVGRQSFQFVAVPEPSTLVIRTGAVGIAVAGRRLGRRRQAVR